MKSIQTKKVKKEAIKDKTFKKSLIAGIIGFLSWASIFLLFIPFADYYKFNKVYTNALLSLLKNPNLYIKLLFIGLLFFLFFYLTLNYKHKNEKAGKIVMWTGIVLYAICYLGYLFLLFFFRFTDL